MDMFDINDSINKTIDSVNANYVILTLGVYLITHRIKGAFPKTPKWQDLTDRFIPLVAIVLGVGLCLVTRTSIGSPFDRSQKLSLGDAVFYGATVGASCSLVYSSIKKLFRKWIAR